MKPIEKGCLAIITKADTPGLQGSQVSVGNFLGGVEAEGTNKKDFWEVDSAVLPSIVCISESILMRVDGGEDLENTEETAEELTA